MEELKKLFDKILFLKQHAENMRLTCSGMEKSYLDGKIQAYNQALVEIQNVLYESIISDINSLGK